MTKSGNKKELEKSPGEEALTEIVSNSAGVRWIKLAALAHNASSGDCFCYNHINYAVSRWFIMTCRLFYYIMYLWKELREF